MYIKNTPTIEYLSESVFKNFVSFEADKVVLKDSCPKELAIIFYYMEPSDIRVVYEMSILSVNVVISLISMLLSNGKWI